KPGQINHRLSSLSSGNSLGEFVGIFSVTILLAIHALVDGRDLLHPTAPLGVLQIQNRLRRPVEVIGDKGYLLVERLEGVAYNPPTPFNSTANSCSHLGQTASTLALPLRLMRL